MKYLNLIILVLLANVVSFVSAQTEFRFNNYSINDGLSQSAVTTIIQDNVNTLWVGTQDGLNRFDGSTFEIFTSDDTEGLESQYIICSAKDRNGNLWFGTSKGLTVFDVSTEEFFTYSPKTGVGIQVIDLVCDNSGALWISTAESGVFKFDIAAKKFISLSNVIKSKKSKKIALSNDGKLIVSTADIGVLSLNVKNNKVNSIRVLKKNTNELMVNNTILLDNGNVVLATNQGVYQVDTKKNIAVGILERFDRQVGLVNLSDVFFQEEIGWLLCSNATGLYLFNNQGEVSRSIADIFQKNALLFNELNTIYRDNSGAYWIGSQRGLSVFNPTQRGILGVGPNGDPTRGIPTPSVWSFSEDKEGKFLFIGTDKSVSRLNKETGVFTQFNRQFSKGENSTGSMAVLGLEAVNSNFLLVGCADGFYELQINGGNYQFKKIKANNSHKRVYSIIHWEGSKYLAATSGGVLCYNIKTKEVTSFEHNVEFPDKTISKGVCRLAYKDLNNRIWFATSTGGLNLLTINDGTPEIRPYEYNSIIKSTSTEYITSIHQEKQGEYWFGTLGSGLIHWNERSKNAKIYSKKEGLPNDVIYSVISEGNGSFWLSTNKGVCNINTKTNVVRNYTEVDGLMSNEFNLGAYLLSSSGNIYFGGIYGYNYFNPKNLKGSTKEVDVLFTKFKLENEWLHPNTKDSPLSKPIYLTNEINLSYKQRSFTVKFQASDISNANIIEYKYLLEGSEEDEIYIGKRNEIHFNALSHGSYNLIVYARIGKGPWSSHPASLQITIATPFWFTWTFWLITAIVLAIIIWVFIRQRIEAARRDQVKLEIKIHERTREIKKQNKKIELQNKKIQEEKNKVVEQQKLLQKEKDKTERLLRKVIPESTAEELKKKGRARARAYKTVSVLFTDFVGFTKISDRMTATELVKKLDVYFRKFDEIIVNNNLEKIKTIGDAYMCAGGVPVRNNTNPIDACLAALQIQAYMLKRKNDAIANGREYWELRLGINTGEVTAGVIGSERLAYDIWGATVNQAQRMEMLGQPEKVTITGATFKHIEPYFECSFLGKAESKSRGLIDMYVVERIKPELSLKEEGVFPNEKFQQVVNLHHYSSINYYKAERHIMKVLEQGLSKQLHYHSIAHTKDVVSAVERIALMEGVTDEGLFLLKSAATYHDAGFVESYENNESIGARMADEILPTYGYTQKHIDLIKELIFVTEIPHTPKNKLEEIICDADLDYLGRDDFHEIADKLKRELMEHGKIQSDKQWDEIQVKFLESHRYFTKTSKKTRKKKKLKNLNEVKERLLRNEYE